MDVAVHGYVSGCQSVTALGSSHEHETMTRMSQLLAWVFGFCVFVCFVRCGYVFPK